MSNNDSTRRRLLQLAGGAGLVTVAGCSSISGTGQQPTDEPTDEPTPMGDGTTDDETPTDGGMMADVTFTLRVENVAPTDFYGSDTATGGQVWITPGAYAVHTGENPSSLPDTRPPSVWRRSRRRAHRPVSRTSPASSTSFPRWMVSPRWVPTLHRTRSRTRTTPWVRFPEPHPSHPAGRSRSR